MRNTTLNGINLFNFAFFKKINIYVRIDALQKQIKKLYCIQNKTVSQRLQTSAAPSGS